MGTGEDEKADANHRLSRQFNSSQPPNATVRHSLYHLSRVQTLQQTSHIPHPTAEELHSQNAFLSTRLETLAGYTHGRPTNTVLQIIGTGKGPSTIEDLAKMYRVFLWEGIVMKDDDPSKQLSIEGTHVSLANGTLTASNMAPHANSSNKLGTAWLEPKAKLATSIKEDNARAIQTLTNSCTELVQSDYAIIPR
jgi:hypothetical protein